MPTGRKARTATPLPARDEQAAERRRQLVRIASDLIEEAGIDAVTLARVTRRARCARTLVYRYFASRQELLAGVLQDYFERLDARLPERDQRAAASRFVAASRRGDPDAIAGVVRIFWEVQVAAGLGGAILRAMPPPTRQIRALLDASRERYERRVTDPLRAAGLSATESRLAVDVMIASFVGLALRWRAGEIAADDAIEIHARATLGLLQGLLARPAKSARAARRQPGARRGAGQLEPRGISGRRPSSRRIVAES
ncbi:MAG TPA: TetR/AcrR family transcriptional regulator [Candidatus Binatia bacterium]|nr:TetR/AcrR family transcriptional regulator [Candidatus Binatia bacterium]